MQHTSDVRHLQTSSDIFRHLQTNSRTVSLVTCHLQSMISSDISFFASSNFQHSPTLQNCAKRLSTLCNVEFALGPWTTESSHAQLHLWGVSGGFGSGSRLRGQSDQTKVHRFEGFKKPGPSFFFEISVPSRCFRFCCPFYFFGG